MSLFTGKKPRLRFETLRTNVDVAIGLAISQSDIENVTRDVIKNSLYRPIELPKKGKQKGRSRTVYKVDPRLRRLHVEIAESLRSSIKLSENAHGFIRGSSILKNARVHYPADVLLNVDIEDFFSSVQEAKIVNIFRNQGASDSAARTLAALCCLSGCLPQGAATSPILSNIACIDMDRNIQLLADKFSAKYTRYADDISISGKSVPSIDQVSQILSSNGFVTNNSKTLISKRGERQYVTGLTLGSSAGVRLPSRFRRALRLDLFISYKNGGVTNNSLQGRLAYAYSIEPEWIKSLTLKYQVGVFKAQP